MAAERDEAGSTGPGLSGTGRDNAGLAAGTSGSAAWGDAPGSADVHAGIAFNPQSQHDEGLRDRAASRVRDAAETVADTAGDLGQRARSFAGDVAGRAGDVASRAKDRMGAVADRAQSALEERGWLDRMRENPLPVLGVAFGIGFLIAGGGRGGSKATRVRGELRSALTAGLSAGLAQGARAFLRNAGAEDGVINSVMQNIPGLGAEFGGGQQGGGSGGRTSSTRGSSQGGRGGSQYGGGYSGGGSMGGGSMGGGSMGRTGRPSSMSGTAGGPGTTQHRGPSHRENL